MSDISKCNDTQCPSNKYCYRFTAPANEFWQSYGSFNREEDADNCDMFWANGLNSIKCKNVHSEGNTCSSNDCRYPKCVEQCKYCHQLNGNHKMSCPTMKIQVNL